MNQKRKIGKRIASWLLCLVMVLTTVNLPAFITTVHAEEVTKTGETNAYIDNITIAGQLIEDCTAEMSGTNWQLRGSTLFINGDIAGNSGIIINAKSGVTSVQVIINKNSTISGALYGIKSNVGLTLTMGALEPTLNIKAGYYGISCNGILMMQGEGIVNVTSDDLAGARAAITQAHMSSEYFTINSGVRLNVNWNASSDIDVYGLQGISVIQGDSDGVGKISVNVNNTGTGNGYAADNSLNITSLKTRADVYTPDQGHMGINVKVVPSLDITVAEPTVGMNPATTATSSSEFIEVDEVGWMNGAYQLAPSGQFQMGKTYKCNCYCTLQDGAEFTPDANITVNGNTAEVNKISESKYRISYEFVIDNIVKEISASVTAPVKGEKPQMTLPESGSGYKFTSIDWYEKDSYNALKNEFAGGKQYRIDLYVEPTDGCELAAEEKLNIIINGKKGEVRRYDGSTTGALIGYTFDATEPEILTNISIDVTAPVDGQYPQSTLPKNDTGYEVNSIQWLNMSTVPPASMDGYKFAVGKSYAVALRIASTDGYKLAPKEELVVTVNGQKAKISSYDASTGTVVVMYSFQTTLGPNGKIVVNEISAVVAEPFAGELPQTTIPEGGTGYEFATIGWVEEESGHILGSQNEFEEGKQYSVRLYVAPESGYELAAEKDLNISVNGKKGEVIRYDGSTGALLSYVFPAAEVDTTEHSYTKYVSLENGTHKVVCADCGKVQSGHEADECLFDDGVITKEPTQTSTGVKTYTCTLCGYTKTETIEKLKAVIPYLHSDLTLPKLGETADKTICTVRESHLVSQVSAKWFDNGKKVTGSLENGKEYELRITYALAPEVLVDACIDSNDSEIFVNGCKMDFFDGDEETGLYCYSLMLVYERHNTTLVPAKDATCGAAGNKAYYVCSDCDDWFEDEEAKKVITDKSKYIIPATGNHDFSKYVSNGDGTHKVMCKDCDAVQEGHDKDTCSGGKATCTKKAKCSECGKEYGKLAEHTLKTTTTKATLTADGKKETKCSVCGKVTKTTKIYAAKTVKLSKTAYTYDGKAKKPTVTIKDSKGKAIATSNYTVKYDDGRKNVGKYNVKITFKGDYKGSKTLTFTINPKATTLKSVTPASKAFTAKWTKQTTQVDGYELEYALDKNFTSSAKKVAVTKNTTISKKISSLKSKKTYYVRVRTYKKVGTKKYYSDWSKVLNVKTK